MAKFSRLAGATSQSVNLFIQNSSSSTGAGLTGLVYSSASMTGYYTFSGASTASTQITLVTLASLSTAYSSGGFKEVDSTHMPGVYRLDLPNAMLAASSGNTVLGYLQGATNMAPCVFEIELTSVDNQSTGFGLVDASANVVQWGGSAISGPATAGIPDVNVKNMNNVAATSITTINAYQGTTQNPTYDGNNYLKVDLVDIAGSAVSASTAQLGVNLVNIAGSAVSTSTAQLGVNTVNIAGHAATLDGNNLLEVDLVDIAGSAVSTSAAQLGVNVVSVAGGASNIKKDQALNGFTFLMTDSTLHVPKTGLTITGQASLNGGTFGTLTNNATEIGNGVYTINLAAADLNANTVLLRFTSSAADDRDILLITQP